MKRIHIITVTNESWGKTRYINPKFALLKNSQSVINQNGNDLVLSNNWLIQAE